MRRIAALCILAMLAGAVWRSLSLGYAELVFRYGGEKGILTARRLVPGNINFFEAPFGRGDSRLARQAVTLNPYRARSWIELGLESESRGDLASAEHFLLQAAQADRTFTPAWALANFYFRRGERSRALEWARISTAMAYPNATPVFALCWKLSQDPEEILFKAIPLKPDLLAQYLMYLIHRGDVGAAGVVADLLLSRGESADTPSLLAYCDVLLRHDRSGEAVDIWNALCARGWIRFHPLDPANGRSLTNGDFSVVPTASGYDWRPATVPGVTITPSAPGYGLRIAFDGSQEQSVQVLLQVLPLSPGQQYALRFSHRTAGIEPGSGLCWEISRLGSEDSPRTASPVDSAGDWSDSEFVFTSPSGPETTSLALAYRRTPGTRRIVGVLWLRDVRLRLLPASPPQPERKETGTSPSPSLGRPR